MKTHMLIKPNIQQRNIYLRCCPGLRPEKKAIDKQKSQLSHRTDWKQSLGKWHARSCKHFPLTVRISSKLDSKCTCTLP